MVENHQIVCGEYRYILSHAPARVTLQVCARLGNAGAALFQGMGMGRGSQRLTNAVAYLLASPELGPTLDFVVNSFSRHTQVLSPNGTTATLADCIDTHFAGRMKDFAKWIEGAIEYECGDFLGEWVEKFLASLTPELPKSDSPSPKDAGPSGPAGG